MSLKKLYPPLLLFFLCVKSTYPSSNFAGQMYVPLGVGGGGAMSGVSISPYAKLWFVGTDMGTLFRSTDEGASWWPVNHLQAVFGSDLTRAVSLGFLPDGKTIFHSVQGKNPQRSTDSGLTFSPIQIDLQKDEYIKYWQADRFNVQRIYCGTSKGLYVSPDRGLSWQKIKGVHEDSIATFIDNKAIYHATKNRIWVSQDDGANFKIYYTPRYYIRQFSAGRDASGLTLAFLDNNGINACNWARLHRGGWPTSRIQETTANCGHVWINSTGNFIRTTQAGGDHLKMAENDSATIYVTGSKKWIRQYGTKVHVSRDKGKTWELKFHQLNWDVVPYSPWPSSKVEYSAIALDVGWWDDGYESFEINKLDSSVVMGSGYFFLHASQNYGETWKAPFTRYAGRADFSPGKEWQTRGIEVISVYRAKFHPRNSNLFYAASADIGGMVSENKGRSFRITKADHNSFYDFSFDRKNDKLVYAASGNSHDYPNDWHANAMRGAGGIYRSDDRGKTWSRLTPEGSEYDRQYLSVGYDSTRKIIYGGTHEKGVIISSDEGKTWQYFNEGMPEGVKIIPQIEINPSNGNVYALVTGNAPHFSNSDRTGIYYLDVTKKATKWVLLRGIVNRPAEVSPGVNMWKYPTAFALDFNSKKEPTTMWLLDYENSNNWLATGIWKSEDGGLTWSRMLQMTHPTGVTIDPKNPKTVHVSGYYTLDGSWGNGGQMHTTDGGKSWKKNLLPPLQQNARNVTLDPDDNKNLFYTYFGGGILKGPNPAY